MIFMRESFMFMIFSRLQLFVTAHFGIKFLVLEDIVLIFQFLLVVCIAAVQLCQIVFMFLIDL